MKKSSVFLAVRGQACTGLPFCVYALYHILLGLRAMCEGCRESDTEINPLKKDTELFFFHCKPYTEYYLFSSFLLSVLLC